MAVLLATATVVATIAAVGAAPPSVAVLDREAGEPAPPTAAVDDDPMLALPPLAEAQRYVLAPPARRLRPDAVYAASRVNHDVVVAGVRADEVGAHALRQGTSDVAEVGGVTVRRAGVGRAGGWFSYELRVPRGRATTLRIEEAGSADARYDVLVGGRRLTTRRLDLYAAQNRPIGTTAYAVRVPADLVRRDRIRVTFRNTGAPGDGARIAGVWALGDRDAGLADRGGSVGNPLGAARNGVTELRADFFGRPYVVYDFGREVGGQVLLDVAGRRGDPRLGLAFSESRTFLSTHSDYSQDPSGVATETHYFRPGRGRLVDPVIRGGFRYLMVFLDRPGTLRIERLRLRYSGDAGNPRPAAYAGAFLSSDDDLNRLWYAGAYTTQMSTIDSDTGRPYPATPGPVANDQVVAPGEQFLSDGAKRDRYDWGGDNVVSNLVAYVTTGRTEPAENALDWFAANPSEAGQVPGVYLPEPAGFTFNWGEYAAWWNQNYWNHYLHTGDRAYLERWFDTLVGNIGWVESSVDDDGLWSVPGDAGGHWGYAQSGKETYDNLVYVHSLTSAVAAAEAMGRDDLAEQWRGYAERTGAAVDELLWDDAAGAYRAMAGSPAHPLDANVLAMLSGVADDERSERIRDFIRTELRTPYGDVGTDTTEGTAVPDYIAPFVSGQELLALAGEGDTEAAHDVLRRTWLPMLRGDTSGTFWETVGPEGELGLGSYTSMSHGWAAAPTSFLTTDTLGVTPVEPGYASFDVSPRPPEGLAWAQGRVPTPYGDIRAAWRRTDDGYRLLVDAPPGTTWTATAPGVDPDDSTLGPFTGRRTLSLPTR